MKWTWLIETKIILALGITFMSVVTMTLILRGTDKEFVMVFASFVGQLIAALLTYITKGTASNDQTTR